MKGTLQMTYYYPAVVHKTAEGYRVSFMDLKDCYGEGPDKESAFDDARNAGVNYLLTELESDQDEQDFPTRTLLEDIIVSDGDEAVMLALVMPRFESWDSFG